MNVHHINSVLLTGILAVSLFSIIGKPSQEAIDATRYGGQAIANSSLGASTSNATTAESILSIVVQRDPTLAKAVVTPSEVAGLWTLTLDGKSAYVSSDGKHIIKGPAKLISQNNAAISRSMETPKVATQEVSKQPATSGLGVDPSALIQADIWPDAGIVPLNFIGDDQRVSIPLITHIENVVSTYSPLVKMGYTDIDSITLSYIANSIPEERLAAVYKPEVPSGASVTVFADPTCPKCQQFHDEIPQLTAAGFEVRYVLLPRNPNDEELSSAIESVYCQAGMDSKLSLIEKLYSGENDGIAKCESDALASINDAVDFYSVKSTPTIYVKNTGVVFPGYVSSSVLIQMEEYRKIKQGLDS